MLCTVCEESGIASASEERLGDILEEPDARFFTDQEARSDRLGALMTGYWRINVSTEGAHDG